MTEVIKQLKTKFPQLNFVAGTQFSWSPDSNEIIYKKGAKSKQAAWSLLHETGHALRAHTDYRADYELLRLEVAAWDEAKQLATELGMEIDEDHIQDCLDTYRDWLNRRCICPNCGNKCLQQADFVHYRCFNCHNIWKVSSNRFGRSYRQTKKIPAETGILFT